MHQRRVTRFAPAFTLVEMLVAVTVLTLLVLLLAQLFGNAATVINTDSKRLDTDAQARGFFDRCAIDIAQMVKRPDVDYFLKRPDLPQPGNDQLAFYSEVPGYYPATSNQSPLSLVAYRMAQTSPRLERLGKGLLWNGAGTPTQSMVFLPLKLADVWPTATNASADADYEVMGADILRFEYYYVLKGGTAPDGTPLTSILSATPWDTRLAGHTEISGLRDVAAIAVLIAVLDAKSRPLATNPQLQAFGIALVDFASAMQPGDLAHQWESVVEQPPAGFPRPAAGAVRIYERHIPIARPTP